MELITKWYATTNLAQSLTDDVQRLLWSILDAFLSETNDPDYLQVFELAVVVRSDEPMQKIRHIQEVPPRDCEVGCFQVDKPYEGTVWVYLDSEGNQTMMFPEDW